MLSHFSHAQLWAPYEQQPTRFLCLWDFPGKNTEVGCHFLLQGFFLTQGLNTCPLHWQADSLPLNHLPMQEMWVRSLGQKNPLVKEMAAHFSILAWEIP